MRAHTVMASATRAAARNTFLFTGGSEGFTLAFASPFGSPGGVSTDADMVVLLIRTRWRRGIGLGRAECSTEHNQRLLLQDFPSSPHPRFHGDGQQRRLPHRHLRSLILLCQANLQISDSPSPRWGFTDHGSVGSAPPTSAG